MKMKKILYFARFVFFIILSSNAFAATYYVDYTTGNDNNSGTSTSSPWKRCPGMVGWSGSHNISAGDTFIFKRGVTWPAATLPLKLSADGGSGAGQEITYKSDSSYGTGRYAIFDAGNTDKNCVSMAYETTDIVFDHIQFKDTSNGGNAISSTGNSIRLEIKNCYFDQSNLSGFQGGSDMVVENNVFECAGGTCVEILYSANLVLRNNDVTGSTGSNAYYALKIGDGCSNSIVEYNYVHDHAGGTGIVFRDNSCNSKIRYNIVNHIKSVSGEAFSSWDVRQGSCDGGYRVYNNVAIIKSGQTAFDQQETTGNYYYNNIVYSIDGGGTAFQARWGGGMTSDYNVVYNVGTYYAGGSAIKGKTNNITADPKFINTAFNSESDFKLQASSPLIDAGTHFDSYSGNDYWGTPVPIGSIPDIGVTEFGESSGIPNPPAHLRVVSQ